MQYILFIIYAGLFLLQSCGKKKEYSTNPQDPYLKDQWHLEMLDIKDSWNKNIKGQNVNVLMVDDGVQIAHPDLKQNMTTSLSYNFSNKTNDPTELEYPHGTMVAGMILARDHNFEGISGIAPRATGIGYNLLAEDNSTLSNIIVSMSRNIDKIHVSNNSWGFDDGFGTFNFASDQIISSLKYATEYGRNGKGTIFVWAAGNGGTNGVDQSNYDGLANQPYVITVGAVGVDYLKADYSEIGANILVCAPSKKKEGELGLLTTDLTLEYGKNAKNKKYLSQEVSNTNYTSSFDGTSGAAPIVSGVIALILQKHPNFSWRDVRLVLAQSAKKIDLSDSDWIENAAGFLINHSYGFGLVNVQNALDLASTWSRKITPMKTYTKLLAISGSSGDINDNTISSSMTVTQSNITKIEFISVTVNLKHTDWGNLNIYLQRKIGDTTWYDVLSASHRCLEEDLVTPTPCLVPLNTWTFGSVRHMGEEANGTWELIISDTVTGNVGKISSWSLTFYGE